MLSFIPTTHAQDKVPALHWNVPSLAVLERRLRDGEFIGTGYTEFTIAMDVPLVQDADAFYVELAVNGQPVRIDGLRPELLSQPMPLDREFRYRFGLENLNFSGLEGGCDTMSATIQLLRQGEPMDEPLILQRSYVALRDAIPVSVTAGGKRFTWTGTYMRPTLSFDHEVFVQSVQVPSLKDKEKLARALSDISDLRDRANRDIQAKFQGQPVTFVVRPPLLKPDHLPKKMGFGLAAGIVEETGQIRFTFDRQDAQKLRDYLKGLGYSRYLIDPESFVYTVNRDLPNLADNCEKF